MLRISGLRKTSVVKTLCVITLLLFPTVVISDNPRTKESPVFVLNQFGLDLRYSLTQCSQNGLPLSVQPLVHPQDIGARHIAWPSAVRFGNTVYLFASIYRNAWEEVGLWTSKDGRTYKFEGVVFRSNELEPNGIGSTHVLINPRGRTPFVMYYLKRGQSGPGSELGIATSVDGVVWKREGIAFSTDQQFERFGISPSFVCQQRTGDFRLFYLAFDREDLGTAVAAIATAESILGPFLNHRVIFEYDGSRFRTRGGFERTRLVELEDSTAVSLGQPYLISNGKMNSTQLVVPIGRRGDALLLDRPLVLNIDSSFEMVSVFTNKVDPSYVWRTSDGKWKGIFTAFGQFSGLTSEYTFLLKSDKLDGPWSFVEGSRVPYFINATRYGLFSTENPIPILDNHLCY